MHLPTLLLVSLCSPLVVLGQCSGWVEPDTSYTIITDEMWYLPPNVGTSTTPPDDGAYGPVALPFTFQFLGMPADSFYINTNGVLSFNWPLTIFNPEAFPSEIAGRVVAPFWGDVDLREDCADCNIVSYKVTPTALYVTWDRVGHWPYVTTRTNSFQVIITDGTDPVVPNGNNVRFGYRDMQWATGNGNGGINGFNGIPAVVGVNRWYPGGVHAAQIGRFAVPGNSFSGSYDGSSGINWLDSARFDLNIADSTGVPPIFAWQANCDTMVVEVGEPFEFQISVIAGGPDQILNVVSTCETLASYTESANISGELASVASLFTPEVDDIGFHHVQYEAQNDLDPPLSSSGTLVIQVIPALSTGMPASDESTFLISPNPVTTSLRYALGQGVRATQVELITIDGRVLLVIPIADGVSGGELDVQDLVAGTYLLKVGGAVSRFVKE